MVKIRVTSVKAIKSGVKAGGWSLELDDPISGLGYQALLERYGAEVVLSYAKEALLAKFRSEVSKLACAGADDKAIVETMKDWKPKIRGSRKTPSEVILENYGNMTLDQRKELLKSLQARQYVDLPS